MLATRPFRLVSALAVFALVASASATAPSLEEDVPAPATFSGDAVTWTPTISHAGVLVVLRGVDGTQARRAFAAEESATLTAADLAALGMTDGEYAYDVIVLTAGETAESSIGLGESGRIAVSNGQISELAGPVITDNQTIRDALCVGFGCADTEAFGPTDLLLKADNLTVVFEDTSTLAGFPSNDWGLIINDGSSGGEEYFGIQDLTAGTTPLRIDPGVQDDGLRMTQSGGNALLGIGTIPGEAIHALTDDIPTLRLEQISPTFGNYSWGLGGYEDYVYIKDEVTGNFPFYVAAGAANNAMVLEDDNVFLGYTGEDINLMVGGDADIIGVTTSTRGLFGFDDPSTAALNTDLEVDGLARFRGNTRIDGTALYFGTADFRGGIIGRGQLAFQSDYSATTPYIFRIRDTPTATEFFRVDNGGNLQIAGTLFQASDATRKQDIVPVDSEAILTAVAGLPISTWQYIAPETSPNAGQRHLGPMAQDFYEAFGLGQGETTIATVDADGVALASVQALHARSEADRVDRAADRARIAELEAENASLADRLDQLEALVARLSASSN